MMSQGPDTPIDSTCPPEPASSDTGGRGAAPADGRCIAWRPDLADIALRHRYRAQRYVSPQARTVRVSRASLRRAPDGTSEQVSELLFGETVHLLEDAGGWSWVQCSRDDYVGYCPTDALEQARASAATHRITVPQASIFAAPSIKARQTGQLFLGSSLVADADTTPAFLQLMRGAGYVHVRHATPLHDPACAGASVLLTMALKFLGTPYVWGGVTRAGIDCSGLVQTLLAHCGISAPRDSDQQRALGRPVDASDWFSGVLVAGDLVFFPGHVGIMADARQLLHANAHWMQTVVEPLTDVVDRLRAAHHPPVIAIRRLF